MSYKNKVPNYMLFIIFLCLAYNSLANDNNELKNSIWECIAGSEKSPIYLSYLPFYDVDTKNSSFSTDIAQVFHDNLFASIFFLSNELLLDIKINQPGNMIKHTDNNVKKLINILSKPGLSEVQKFLKIEKEFIDPNKTDIICAAKYKQQNKKINITFYLINKKNKKIVTLWKDYSFLSYICDEVSEPDKPSKKVLCKHQIIEGLKTFLELLDKSCGNIVKTQNSNNINQKKDNNNK